MTARDPITIAVIESALIATSEEMSQALYRSAYSPIIREMLDYSCAVLAPDGTVVAQAENIPALLGSMGVCLPYLLSDNPVGTLRDGDIFIANDPYRGGTHTPDIHIFMPVFADGRLVAWTGSLAHHADIGGTNPGTEGFANRSIFEEGLRFPNIRLYDEGRPCEPLFRYIEANIREPAATLGDLRAQVAAVKLGALRIRELVERYGAGEISGAMADILDQAERRIRARIAQRPDGRASAVGHLDDGGIGEDPVRVQATVEVREDQIHVDFAGTDAQLAGGLNASRTAVMAGILFVVKAVFDADGVQNGGCARPITVNLPEGSLVNPRYPAAVSLRHLTAQRITDTVIRAFSGLYRDTAVAGSFVGFSSMTGEGRHPRTGAVTVPQDVLGGGIGGNAHGDGLDAVDTYLGNVGMLPAEVCEMQYPVRVVKTELIPDSAGAGRHRGGLGFERIYEFTDDCDLVAYSEQTDPRFSPWGTQGGLPGSAASMTVVRTDGTQIAVRKARLMVAAGDRLVVRTSGGGGFGDPRTRDRELVARDLREGKITLEQAREVYGYRGD